MNMSVRPSQKDQYRLPFLFTLAILLAYGIPVFLGWFGFYGDDWIYIQNYRMAGAQSFSAFVAWDRPWSAWVYQAATALFGARVLPYHLLLLAQRWLAVFLFWRILKKIWRNADQLIAWSVLLFAVYPGFRQQPIAVQYILHFASLDLCLFSIWCMLRTLESEKNANPKWLRVVYPAIGFAAALIALFSCEYFFGLELTRPLFLGFFLVNQLQPRKFPWKTLMLAWAPYLAALLMFVYWRVFVFSFQTYQPKLIEAFSAAPLQTAGAMLKQVMLDLFTVTLLVWRRTLSLPSNIRSHTVWAALLLIVFLFFVIALSRSRSRSEHGKEDHRRFWFQNPTLQLFLIGVASLLAAGIPFWMTGIQVEWAFPWDRPALSFSLGSAMVIAAIIPLIFTVFTRPLIVALLITLAIGAHTASNITYRNENHKMTDYFWQLAWRAPDLTPGTILVSEEIPLDRYSDNDLTPVVNWQYAPELEGLNYQYKYFDLHLRYQTFFAGQEKNQPVIHDYRSHHFESDTSHVLALTWQPDGCLWALSANDADLPGLPENLKNILPLSDLSLIHKAGENPAAAPSALGPEPEHGYCYYFQKINLALQQHDVEQAFALAQEADKKELNPAVAHDWLPLIKASILTDEPDLARKILAANREDRSTREFFCSQLRKLDSSADLQAAWELPDAAGCAP